MPQKPRGRPDDAIRPRLGGLVLISIFYSARTPRRDTVVTTKRVLVVEDDPDAREGMQLALRHRGHQVIVARTASAALGLMKWEPQVIVLDLMLPDQDGLSVLRHVRDRRMAVQVLIATGAGGGPLLREAEALGPDAIYRKPIDWIELAERLAAVQIDAMTDTDI
jgi:DNA-binding response OmpR family regulator